MLMVMALRPLRALDAEDGIFAINLPPLFFLLSKVRELQNGIVQIFEGDVFRFFKDKAVSGCFVDLIIDKEPLQRVIVLFDHCPDEPDLLFAGSMLESIRGSYDVIHNEVGHCEIAELIGEHVQPEQRERGGRRCL